MLDELRTTLSKALASVTVPAIFHYYTHRNVYFGFLPVRLLTYGTDYCKAAVLGYEGKSGYTQNRLES